MRRRLTDKQLEIMVFLRDFARVHNRVPTGSTISEHFGFTYDNAQCYLVKLVKRGWLEHTGYGKYEFAREQEALNA
jgi:hypothetical protein